MRKITLLIASLLLTVGAMAQAVSYTVSMNTGTLANYSSGTQGNWNYKWSFTPTAEKPVALTLAATNNANNIQANGNNMNIFAGTANNCEYKLSVPEGYIIESYSFDFVTSGNNAVTITPAGGSAVQSSTNKQTLAVDNINATETTFRLTGGNYGFTSSNFVVVISKDASNENTIFNWTNSTNWTTADDLTSAVLNDNQFGYGIKYIEQDITVAGPRTATVTFQYKSGNPCALNMRGVEVVDSIGNIVAGDYHVGKAGSSHENHVYTVKVAEAGTYTVRVYATFDSNNRAESTAGTITVAFAAADVADFSHNVTFAADYATLHLGYKTEVPTGVEAYVVSSIENGYAIMAQVESVIPAATPVILKLAEGAEATSTYTFAYTTEEAHEIESNLLEGSIADRYVQGDAYVLGYAEGTTDVIFGKAKLTNGSFLNNANKAYLPMSNPSGVAYYSFRFGGNTTAVEEVETESAEAVIYDLSGRRINEITEAGIYIVNGKKVLVK